MHSKMAENTPSTSAYRCLVTIDSLSIKSMDAICRIKMLLAKKPKTYLRIKINGTCTITVLLKNNQPTYLHIKINDICTIFVLQYSAEQESISETCQ